MSSDAYPRARTGRRRTGGRIRPEDRLLARRDVQGRRAGDDPVAHGDLAAPARS